MIERERVATVGDLSTWLAGEIYCGTANFLGFRFVVESQTPEGLPVVSVQIDPNTSSKPDATIAEFNQMDIRGVLLGSSEHGIPKPLSDELEEEAPSDPDHATYIDDLTLGEIQRNAFLVIDTQDDEPLTVLPPLMQVGRLSV